MRIIVLLAVVGCDALPPGAGAADGGVPNGDGSLLPSDGSRPDCDPPMRECGVERLRIFSVASRSPKGECVYDTRSEICCGPCAAEPWCVDGECVCAPITPCCGNGIREVEWRDGGLWSGESCDGDDLGGAPACATCTEHCRLDESACERDAGSDGETLTAPVASSMIAVERSNIMPLFAVGTEEKGKAEEYVETMKAVPGGRIKLRKEIAVIRAKAAAGDPKACAAYLKLRELADEKNRAIAGAMYASPYPTGAGRFRRLYHRGLTV